MVSLWEIVVINKAWRIKKCECSKIEELSPISLTCYLAATDNKYRNNKKKKVKITLVTIHSINSERLYEVPTLLLFSCYYHTNGAVAVRVTSR